MSGFSQHQTWKVMSTSTPITEAGWIFVLNSHIIGHPNEIILIIEEIGKILYDGK